MGKRTGITWTDATWNPWRGCHKVSAGCANCYMFRDAKRYGNDPTQVVRSKTTFNDPLKWKEGRKIFVCSWSDFFIEEADAWRDEAWDVMRRAPQHTYQICTKRIERAKQCLPSDWGDGWPNVWLGATVENESAMDRRLPVLLSIPTRVCFASCEPLLEEIDLLSYFDGSWSNDNADENFAFSLDWVIVGGESGTGARRFDESWARRIIEEADSYSVPVFVKQMGSNPFGYFLKHPHGADRSEWPEDLRVQEFPVSVK